MHILYIETSTFVIGCYEAQDVLVAQHYGLVDLRLAEPRPLLSGGEDLHRHIPAPPAAAPHLPEAALPDDLLEHDGPGHRALHKQRQACSRSTDMPGREHNTGISESRTQEAQFRHGT